MFTCCSCLIFGDYIFNLIHNYLVTLNHDHLFPLVNVFDAADSCQTDWAIVSAVIPNEARGADALVIIESDRGSAVGF